ncbi:MAG: Fur family transcriptional regulator [Parvularcula sp.]|jgi:Fur family zinc uptake transcriptional regulator|nr:Fur family transcriptional regulator [Parvularcula sp.]
MATLATERSHGGVNRRVRLTKNDRLVLNALEAASGPLKAYDLLERLKGQGIGAPMTVYRALDRLQKQGLVHKLDGLGAFMVCEHGEPHEVETFLICKDCDGVEELREPSSALSDVAHRLSHEHNFEAESVRVEIRGTCTNCGD